MIQEINGSEDATQKLGAFFGKIDHFKHYVEMLDLLCDEKRFTEGLEKVSGMIWEAYNSKEIQNAPNRYTRSIVAVANQCFGFACQENVVLTAAAGGKAFGQRIRNGVLWKDSFALGHGEFAHSYQWLVSGALLGWGKGTAEVYRNTAGKQSLVPLFVKDNAGIVLRPTQLWEYIVDSTKYVSSFDNQARGAAQTWVNTQLENWSRNDPENHPVNKSFVNLYFRGTDPGMEGSCNLGQDYDTIAAKRTKDIPTNLSLAKKSGKHGKFIDSLVKTFPVRNALTEKSFRNANNVTDLARRSHNPPWFITVYEDHRQARLYERSNEKLRQLASRLLAEEKLNREGSPLRNDQRWLQIEALLCEIELMFGNSWNTKSDTFYRDLKKEVAQQADKLGVNKTVQDEWFREKLKGIPALKRERQEHYSSFLKRGQGWATATDDAGIFVRKILESDVVQKGVTVADFHGRTGTVSKNALPGQLSV